VLARCWRGAQAGGLQWAGITPALLMPVVGNVSVPLAGVALGHADWAAAQFGIGLMFWPVVLGLLLTRIVVQGMVSERLLPTFFILIAPPALIGLALLEFGAPRLLGLGCWGMALFCLLWALALTQRIRRLAFSVTHWSLSFPLAAFSALTLRLAEPGTALAVAGPAALALCSIIVLGLLLATWRGLREGSLLAPEPVAAIVNAQAP
jgi:tellurite resistance protein